jgi:hypothetical protein
VSFDGRLEEFTPPTRLTVEEIRLIVADFRKAARNAIDAGTYHTLAEKGSLVQHPNIICPGLTRQWGPMTDIGLGSCRLGAGPGSFQGIGLGL